MIRDPSAVLADAVRRASVTRAVLIDPGALTRLPQVIGALGDTRPVQVVADPNTMEAAGHAAMAALRAAGCATAPPIVLDESPRVKPRVETAQAVAARLAAAGALPVAVGAGVINDVTKYAAELAHRPYVSVATAASMDGYAASGAAMLDAGFKRTFACPPPIAIVGDLDVIAKAPPRMAAWGFGDLAGKIVAGADWILADAAGEERLDELPFALVQENLKDWLAHGEGIATGDRTALRALMNGLLISGFAMQAHGNSRPASGSEHQMSHVWEMDRVAVDGEPVSHGACVGVGTVAMLALYEWFLAQDVAAAALAPGGHAPSEQHRIETEVQASFRDAALVESVRTEVAAKLARASQRPARLRALAAAWPALRDRIRATLVTSATMEGWLAACGAATHPGDLGVALEKLARDYRRARLIRRRYTILDCLEDLGWLDTAIAALFGNGGYWEGRSAGARPAPPKEQVRSES